jgi:hypothetical protein
VNQLLSNVINAHGGLDRWKEILTVVPTLTFGGLAFQSRFNNAGLVERKIKVSVRKPKVILEDFPEKSYRGFFTPDKVWIEHRGEVVQHRFFPREAFKSLRHSFYWDDLDLLYFAGYAGWNYFNSPFLLAYEGVETREIEPWIEKGERWHRLEVKFPPSIPTHCQNQVFYFDQSYHMVRFDYCPEVYASWARGAHYCTAYKTWDGIRMPTRRKVFPNRANNKSTYFPTIVWIKVNHIDFE